MKRLSYMHDYATPDGTVVHAAFPTPRLLQSHKHSGTVRKTTFTPALALSSAKNSTARMCSQKNVDRENVQPSGKRVPKAPHNTTKPSRRYNNYIHLVCIHLLYIYKCTHCLGLNATHM